MKKVKDLFAVDVFHEAKIIAGHNGADRIVESIEVSETPDVINYLADHSLLLTTGFAFKDDPKRLCTLISQMNEHSCAGIAIKLKRFIDQLPQEVLDLANFLDFPIILIPQTLTLGNCANQLLSFLWNNKTEELFHAIQVQKRFTEMMLKGYNLQALIENLGYFLRCPVLLLNPLGEICCSTQHFNLKSMKNVKEYVEDIFKNDIEHYREKKTLLVKNPNDSKSTMVLSIFQVKSMNPYPYLLIVFDTDQLQYPSSKLAIEQASTVISSTLLKNEAINESSRLLENNFFGSLVDGNITSKEEIIYRGRSYGLIENGDYFCVVFKNDEKGNNSFSREEEVMNRTYDFLYSLVNKFIGKLDQYIILFMKDEYFVLIIQTPRNFDESIRKVVKDKLEQFQEAAQAKLSLSLSFGIGNVVNDIRNIPISYSEAIDAWKQGKKLYHCKFINHYETKKLKELMMLVPTENLQEFYENTLRSLAYPKTKDEEDLANTLKVYLDHNCQIAATAKKLFVHRNTVKYRIDKCEEILGYSVDDEQNSLNLRIALLLRTLFTKQ